MWSPYEIEVMLHHHVSDSPFPRSDAPAYSECTKKLIGNGLLEYVGYRDGVLKATKLGDAFVRLLCETPVPVAEYRDPRFRSSGSVKYDPGKTVVDFREWHPDDLKTVGS